MRVAVYYNNNDIRLEERPKPSIGHNEFLFKVMASGICGSDVLEWYRIPKSPRISWKKMAIITYFSIL